MAFSIISYVVLAALELAIGFLISPDEFSGRMAIGFLIILIQAYTTLGLYKLIFTLIDSEYYEFAFKQVLPSFKMLLSYLVVGFVMAFVIANFAILLNYTEKYPIAYDITKGIGFAVALYLFLRVMFFITFIVDDQSRPFESMKQSFRLTKGFLLKMLIILFLILLLVAGPAKISEYYGFASILLAFTYPLASIVLSVAYRKLVYSHQDVDDDLAETK
ncbi:MAG: hypothetical protein ACHQHN_18135 [Sphingobacteriales bacterium]